MPAPPPRMFALCEDAATQSVRRPPDEGKGHRPAALVTMAAPPPGRRPRLPLTNPRARMLAKCRWIARWCDIVPLNTQSSVALRPSGHAAPPHILFMETLRMLHGHSERLLARRRPRFLRLSRKRGNLHSDECAAGDQPVRKRFQRPRSRLSPRRGYRAVSEQSRLRNLYGNGPGL